MYTKLGTTGLTQSVSLTTKRPTFTDLLYEKKRSQLRKKWFEGGTTAANRATDHVSLVVQRKHQTALNVLGLQGCYRIPDVDLAGLVGRFQAKERRYSNYCDVALRAACWGQPEIEK